MRARRVIVDPLLDLVTEVADQTLDRPSRRVAERADGVAFDLGRNFEQHVDLALLGAAFRHAGEHAPHPARAFAAGGALAAALVLVEICQASDGADDVGGLVHDDHGGSAEAGLQIAQGVEIHMGIGDLLGRNDRHGGAAGDHAEQVVPAAADAAAMGVDQLPEGEAHGLFHVAGLVYVARDAEELGAHVVRAADAGEPRGAATEDRAGDCDGFYVVHRGRAAVEAHIGREGRLQARHALLALHALKERRLLATDIGARAVVDVKIEGIAVDVVLADEPGLIGLVHRALERIALGHVLATDIDVGRMSAHGEGGDEAALDQEMRIIPHDLPVLAGAGLRLVCVDHEVVRALAGLLGHEGPLQARGEASAAAAAQPRRLHLINDPVAPLFEEELGSVPRAAHLRALKIRRMEAVEVGEDTISVLTHSRSLHQDDLLSLSTTTSGLLSLPSRRVSAWAGGVPATGVVGLTGTGDPSSGLDGVAT